MLLLLQNSYLLACRKGWPTANGFKHVFQNPRFLDMLPLSDEAELLLLGYINSENMCVGCCGSSCHSWGVSLSIHGKRKCGMLCPIPTHTTVNADIYFNSFQESVSHVDDQELPFGYFQEDGATYHTPEWPLE
jgi:hypothetical protein